jgi:hypothetical protein
LAGTEQAQQFKCSCGSKRSVGQPKPPHNHHRPHESTGEHNRGHSARSNCAEYLPYATLNTTHSIVLQEQPSELHHNWAQTHTLTALLLHLVLPTRRRRTHVCGLVTVPSVTDSIGGGKEVNKERCGADVHCAGRRLSTIRRRQTDMQHSLCTEMEIVTNT